MADYTGPKIEGAIRGSSQAASGVITTSLLSRFWVWGIVIIAILIVIWISRVEPRVAKAADFEFYNKKWYRSDGDLLIDVTINGPDTITSDGTERDIVDPVISRWSSLYSKIAGSKPTIEFNVENNKGKYQRVILTRATKHSINIEINGEIEVYHDDEKRAV